MLKSSSVDNNNNNLCPVCGSDHEKLDILANWIDQIDWSKDKEVQTDLRTWAKNIRQYYKWRNK